MRRFAVLSVIIILFIFPSSVSADIAPPAQPPGSNLQPGTESTQVQMAAETVLIDVQAGAPAKSFGQAHVTASFTMHNQGGQAESMAVRFPISGSDGFSSVQQIKDLRVKVGGKSVSTRTIKGEDPNGGQAQVPWAEFDVSFPPGQDVQIQVAYTLEASGEYPFCWFKYILSTGAAWKDAIGKADLIVRLPYPANDQNVFFFSGNANANSTPDGTRGGVISGNEVRWHFDNLEPTRNDDFGVDLVMPSAWENSLTELNNINKNSKDGEAWGRLGKLYKAMTFSSRGKGFRTWPALDAGALELYQLSLQAYEKATSLEPKDPLWHAGFADLLSYHAYFLNMEGVDKTGEELRALQEIQRALDLAPNDSKVQEIAAEISSDFPDGMKQNGSSYDYPWLTATPLPPTPMAQSILSTDTPLPENTSTPASAALSPTPAGEPSTNTKPSLPFCSGALLLPFAALILFQRRMVAARKTRS
jgi:tetratricopeptide (TPR) repeat protein